MSSFPWLTVTRPQDWPRARRFDELGFGLVATSGTAAHLRDHGVPVASVVAKVSGSAAATSDNEPDAADGVELISSGAVQLVVNSPRGRGPRADGAHLRRAAAINKIPLLTTAAAALAVANGIADLRLREPSVRSLQSYHLGQSEDPEPEPVESGP